LILAEWAKLPQKLIKNRLMLTLPLLAVATVLTQIDFDILWRYFSWSNQTLAMISLWVATSFLIHKGRYKLGSLITALPASFMTAVSVTYIMMADEGFGLSGRASYPVGALMGLFMFIVYIIELQRWSHKPADVRKNWKSL